MKGRHKGSEKWKENFSWKTWKEDATCESCKDNIKTEVKQIVCELDSSVSV